MEFKKPMNKANSETLARLQLRTLRESHEATQRTLLLQNKQRMELDVLSPLERMRSIQKGIQHHQQQKQQLLEEEQRHRQTAALQSPSKPHSPLPRSPSASTRKKVPNSISSLIRRYVLHSIIIGSYALLLFYATISSSLPGGNAAGRLAIAATHGTASPISDIVSSLPFFPPSSSPTSPSSPSSILTTHQTALWSTIAHLFLNSQPSTPSISAYSKTTASSKHPSYSPSTPSSFSVARHLNLLSSVWSSLTAIFLFLTTISFSFFDLDSLEDESSPSPSPSSTFLGGTLASWRPWAGLLACGIYILSSPVWAQSIQVGPATFHAMLTCIMYLSLMLVEGESKKLELSSGDEEMNKRSFLRRAMRILLPSKLTFLLFLIFLIFGWKAIDRDFSLVFILPAIAFIKGQYSRVRESLADDEEVDGYRHIFLVCGIGFLVGFLTPFFINSSSTTLLSSSSSSSSLQQTLTPLSEAWMKRWIEGRSFFSHTFELSIFRLKLYLNVVIRGWWWTLPTFFFCLLKRWTLPLALSLSELLAVMVQPLLIPDTELLTKYHPSPLLRSSAATAPSSRSGELEVLPFFPQLPLIMAISFPHLLWAFLRKATPGARYQFRQFVFASIAITVVVTQLWYSSISSVHNRPNQLNSVMVYGNSILNNMPSETIVLINSELAENVLNYLQHCEEKRTDITLLNLRGMSYFLSTPSTRKDIQFFSPFTSRVSSSPSSSSDSIVASFANLNIDKYPIAYCGDWHESDSSMLQLAESSFVALPLGFCFQLFRREKKPDYRTWMERRRPPTIMTTTTTTTTASSSTKTKEHQQRQREEASEEEQREELFFLPSREELRTPSWDWDPNAQWDAAVLDAYWQAEHYLGHFVLNRAIEIKNNRREQREHRTAAELSARLYSTIVLNNPNTAGKHIWFNLALSLDQLRTHISSSTSSSTSTSSSGVEEDSKHSTSSSSSSYTSSSTTPTTPPATTTTSSTSSSSSRSSSPSSLTQLVTDMVSSYKRYLSLESPSHPNYSTVEKLVAEWEHYLLVKQSSTSN